MEECPNAYAGPRTRGPAWPLGLDHGVGSMEGGKGADLAGLHDDPLAVDPMALKDIAVWGTVLSGRVFPAGG